MKFNDADSSLSESEEVCEESELKRVKIEKMEPEMIMAGMGSRKRKGNKEKKQQHPVTIVNVGQYKVSRRRAD